MRATIRLLLAAILLAQIIYIGLVLGASDTPERNAAAENPTLLFMSTMHQIVQMSLLSAPPDPGSGGAITAIGDIVLLVTRTGEIHVFDGLAAFKPVDIPSPADFAMISSQFKRPKDQSSAGVKDMIARTIGDEVEIFLSHTLVETGDDDQPCARLAVSRISTPWPVPADPPSGWSTVYRTQPCLSIAAHVFPLQTAGNLAFLDEDTIILTSGDHGFDDVGRKLATARPQDLANDYGKSLRIDLTSGNAEVFTIGHRNNSGLVIDSTGRIWATEHGPNGGDELNLLVWGENYGWPLDTLGVDYGKTDWPGNPNTGTHSRFRRPIFSWLPSKGLSEIIEMRGDEFPNWRGDFLIATLKGKSLLRVRVAENRVLFVEEFPINERLRDLTEDRQGRIYIKLDSAPVVLVFARAEAEIDPALTTCTACHQISSDVIGEFAGPSLVGVIGRDIASLDYPYSASLKAIGGVWTEGTLRAFLADGEGFAPGSAMPQQDLSDSYISAVLNALSR